MQRTMCQGPSIPPDADFVTYAVLRKDVFRGSIRTAPWTKRTMGVEA
jgi:hypothetical protein